MRLNESIQRALLRVVVVLGMVLISGTALGDVLYDVTFSSPPHVVGQLPAVGAGPTPRITVSTNTGSPEIVAQSGLLVEQPAEFDLGLEQVWFDLDDLPPSSTYRVECDLLVDDTSNIFSYLRVSFITPTVRNINFTGSGEVEYLVPPAAAAIFASFDLNAVVHLRVDIDLGGDTWTIYLDDVLRHTGSFGGATVVEQVAILSTGSLAFPVRGAVDNVLIESSPIVPVEGASWGAVKRMHHLEP